MTRDDIIRMARECGIDAENDTLCRNEGWVEPLEAFAKRVVASIDPKSWMSYQVGFEAGAVAEREACAKVCDAIDVEYEGEDVLATLCAAAIRARGKK